MSHHKRIDEIVRIHLNEKKYVAPKTVPWSKKVYMDNLGSWGWNLVFSSKKYKDYIKELSTDDEDNDPISGYGMADPERDVTSLIYAATKAKFGYPTIDIGDEAMELQIEIFSGNQTNEKEFREADAFVKRLEKIFGKSEVYFDDY